VLLTRACPSATSRLYFIYHAFRSLHHFTFGFDIDSIGGTWSQTWHFGRYLEHHCQRGGQRTDKQYNASRRGGDCQTKFLESSINAGYAYHSFVPEKLNISQTRIAVTTSLDAAQATLTQVSSLANSTGNIDVSNLALYAQDSIIDGRAAVGRIETTFASGVKPSHTEYVISIGIRVRDSSITLSNLSARLLQHLTPDPTSRLYN